MDICRRFVQLNSFLLFWMWDIYIPQKERYFRKHFFFILICIPIYIAFQLERESKFVFACYWIKLNALKCGWETFIDKRNKVLQVKDIKKKKNTKMISNRRPVRVNQEYSVKANQIHTYRRNTHTQIDIYPQTLIQVWKENWHQGFCQTFQFEGGGQI